MSVETRIAALQAASRTRSAGSSTAVLEIADAYAAWIDSPPAPPDEDSLPVVTSEASMLAEELAGQIRWSVLRTLIDRVTGRACKG